MLLCVLFMFAGTVVGVVVGITIIVIGMTLVCVAIIVICRKRCTKDTCAVHIPGRNCYVGHTYMYIA